MAVKNIDKFIPMQKRKNRFQSDENSHRTHRYTPELSLHNILYDSKSIGIIFYNPDVMIHEKSVKLLSQVISNEEGIINKIVIVTSNKDTRDLNDYESMLNDKGENDTVIMCVRLSELPEIYGQIIDDVCNYSTSIIFEDINNLEQLETITNNSHTFDKGFKHVVIMTSSVTIFTNIKERIPSCLPYFHDRRNYVSYFQNFCDKAKLVEYKNVKGEFYLDSIAEKQVINCKFFTLSQFINDLRMGNISEDMFSGELSILKSLGDRLTVLLLNGVYDSKFVLNIVKRSPSLDFIGKYLDDLEYTSNKLSKFLEVINIHSSQDLLVVFKKKSLISIIRSILQFYYPESHVMDGEDIIILNRNKQESLRLTLLDVGHYTSSSYDSNHVLLFDYVQVKPTDHTVVLITSTERTYLLEQLEKEKELRMTEDEGVPGINSSNRSKYNNHDVQIKLYGRSDITAEDLTRVLTELKFVIKDMNLQDKTFKLKKTNNLSYFGVKLASTFPHAVEVSNLKGCIDNFSIVAEYVAFGTIVNFNLFTDPYYLKIDTFVFPRNDVILLYCVSGTKLTKIKIQNSCMERYILIDKMGLIVDVYLCIGKKPKIYMADLSDIKLQKLKTLVKTRDRYDFLENIQWNRASLHEMPFIKTRSDIKVRINLRNNPDQAKLKSFVLAQKQNYSRNNESQSFQDSDHGYKVKLYDTIDHLIYVFNGYQGVNVLFSNVTTSNTDKLSMDQIHEQFREEEFSNYYFIVCLLSQKGRFFNYNLDLDDCESIRMNVKGMVMGLLEKVNARFMNIKKILEAVKDRKFTYDDNSHLMRHVIVTPLSVIYKLPIPFEGNRVLREFDHEKFLRVSLREEDKTSKVKDSTTKNQNMIYNYYRSILCDGFFIGERKYFFLAMTMSQMRLHSSWFVTPYFHKNLLIGTDYIRNWLGDFSKIKNIGKYAIRLGQALSSTFETINVERFAEVRDVEKNNYVFSDGIGLLSFSAAKEISKILQIGHIPSAFQIRFAGFKGVVGVHPIIDEDKVIFKDDRFEECKDRIMKNLQISTIVSNSEDENKVNKFTGIDQTVINLITRPSMKKFISSHRNIEVVTYASCQACYLNRQYIMLLEGLGIDMSIFLEHHDNYIFGQLSDIYGKPNEYIKRYFGLYPEIFNLKNSKLYRKLIMAIFNKQMKDFYKKNRILIQRGCVLMGVLDEMALLEENEVYIKIKKDSVIHNEGFIVKGEYLIVVGPVLIMKNPCLHPGDIRRVMAVDKPELGYLQNVLVFNQKGERPLPNMCSGSDLDGDMYTVIWEPSLIPNKSFEPSEYIGSTVLNKEIVSSKDIVNFYIRYIRNYHLGSIAHAHLVHCDEKSINHESSLFLAELFNRSIDFPKTGFMAVVPETLIPRRYPDFMESKFITYPSLKTVGVLFRRGFDAQVTRNIKCECKRCIEAALERLPHFVRDVLDGSDIFYKEVSCKMAISSKSLEIFNKFKEDISSLVERYGYKKEEMAFLHFAEEEESFDEILIDIKRVFTKYRTIVQGNKMNCNELLILSEECQESISSMPLVFPNSFIMEEKIDLKPLHKHWHLENRFILNSAVIINYFSENDSVVEVRGNLETYVESHLYGSLLKNVSESNRNILKEIFNLLLIGKFFHIRSFDLVCLFLNYFIGKFQSEEIDRAKACRVLLEVSREFYSKAATLPFCHFVNREILTERGKKAGGLIYRASMHTKNHFHIRQKYSENNDMVKIVIDNLARIVSTAAILLMLKNNFIDKALHIYYIKKEVKEVSKAEHHLVRKKVESYSHFIVKGMFDGSDELKLESYNGPRMVRHNQMPLYTPKLLNKGFCDSDAYKDSLREFFMNIFLGGLPEHVGTDKHLGIYLQMTITPGKFYLQNVDPMSINTILTIDELKAKTIFYKGENPDASTLQSYFYNYSDVYDGNLRQKYISDKGISFGQKTYEYILSFIRENGRYQVYLNKTEEGYTPKRICRNKKLKGKAFVVKDGTSDIPNDVLLELSYEEIILDGNNNRFTKEEKKFFGDILLTEKNNAFIVNKSLAESKQFRFEINTMLENRVENESPFTLTSREVFTPGRDPLVLNNKKTRLAVYSSVTRVYNRKKDLGQYIEDFNRVWKCYKTYYC